MGRKHIEGVAESAHDAATLYGLLLDPATWPSWCGIDEHEGGEPGSPDPLGVGAVRRFRTGRVHSVERVVEAVPGRRFSYELVEGMPLVGYRADVDLAPLPGGGTRITWASSFAPRRKGTGWFYALVLGRFIQRTASGLAGATIPSVPPARTGP